MVGTNSANVIVIPARLESKRLKNKLLLKETGKTLLQHTYEAAMKSQLATHVFIATNSDEISDAAGEFVVKSDRTRVIMTGEQPTGTHRCCEAVCIVKHSWGMFGRDTSAISDAAIRVINWQADEPCINATVADAMFLYSQMTSHPITAAAKFIPGQIYSNDIVKVVYTEVPCGMGKAVGIGQAIYFSRAPMRGSRHHVGIYCYSLEGLLKYTELPENHFSKSENLEQLRVLSDPDLQFEIFPIAEAPLSINSRMDYDDFLELMPCPRPDDNESSEESGSSACSNIPDPKGSTH